MIFKLFFTGITHDCSWFSQVLHTLFHELKTVYYKKKEEISYLKKKPIFIDNGKSYLVADIKKIKKLGWKAKYNIYEILNQSLSVR